MRTINGPYGRGTAGIRQAAADAIGANYRYEVQAGMTNPPPRKGAGRTIGALLLLLATVAVAFYLSTHIH